MTLFKKPSPSNHPPTIPNPTKSPTTGTIARLAILLALTGIALYGPTAKHVLAKTAKPAQTADAKTNPAPAIDPDAIEALNDMGKYLRTLKSFQVDADTTHDDVLDDGQIVTNIGKSSLLAVAPNLLRVEIKADDRNTFLFFDGKNFTIYGKLHNFYATVPAPPTIREFIKVADERYGVEVPLVDLFKWGTDDDTIKKITAATDLGPSTVEGTTCEHLAFRQEGLDWQIWIQLGDFPLPRKFIIHTLTDEARPQHSSTLTWNLAPSYNEAAFTFDPPPGAQRIAMQDLKAKAANQ
jgi:hypothetical protein